jgi:hypothetical protein
MFFSRRSRACAFGSVRSSRVIGSVIGSGVGGVIYIVYIF